MQKDVFWKAAVLTFVILTAGIQIGIWLDSGRIEELKKSLTETDIQFSDARLQSAYLDSFLDADGAFCRSALEANLDFNDRIYQQGRQLERFEQVSRFTEKELELERKRYALLQFQFWMNALRIKEACGFNYTTILYVYRSEVKNATEVELSQKLQSATLLELKEKCGQQLMLSPVPLDLGLASIDTVVRNYGIRDTPTLVINNGPGNATVRTGFTKLDELEKLVIC